MAKAFKFGDMVEVKLGRVVFDIKPGDDTSRDTCYVCGKPATAWPYPEKGGTAHGFAMINGERSVLLCEQCFSSDEQRTAIMRKYLNAPNLEVKKGGTYKDIEELRPIAQAFAERGDKLIN
jgi:hypothetical protein